VNIFAFIDLCPAIAYLEPMSIREILTVPDPRLREVCQPVGQVDDEVRALLDDMLETMYDAPGIGLAAIQIGVAKRCLVMDISNRDGDDAGADESAAAPLYMVNPEIVWTSDEVCDFEEGCLSVPEFYETVERPERCRVKYLDYHGKPQELECDGMLATCVQHEIDHLDGALFIDHISKLKRDRIIRKFTKELKLRQKGAA
jgi:peptide deformylase